MSNPTSDEKVQPTNPSVHSGEKIHASDDSNSDLPVDELPSAENTQSEKRLLRKLDWHILPLISIMHLLSFLDRSNFGNAKAATPGLEKTLHLPSYGYNLAAAMFYIFYAAFEVPSNLLMKKIGPQRWYPFQTVAWGIVCTLIGVTHNFGGLIAVRIFLGITEAGLFPGFGYYISLWYKRNELAWRISIFYASTTASGAFGGILTYGILKMNHDGGLVGWRWIFILEGIFTVFVGIFAFWGMHGLPEDAKFLTEDERRQVQERLAIDREGMNTDYNIEYLYQGLKDWKSYLYAIIYLGNAIVVYALSLFLPSIITDLGYKAADAQLLSTPPYILAMLVALLFAHLSDRYRLRGPFILISQALTIIGFSILLAKTNPKKAKYQYLGTFFTTTGAYSAVPVMLSWASNNTGGDTKKGVRIALMVGLGNLGGICSSFVYRNQDKPKYLLGHRVMISVTCMSWVSVCIAMFAFRKINAKKEEQCKREGLEARHAKDFVTMGDDSPLFRFSI